MRKIVSGDTAVNAASVEDLSAKWVALTGSEEAARGEMVVVTPIIEGIIGRVFGKWKQKEYSTLMNNRENQAPEPSRQSCPRSMFRVPEIDSIEFDERSYMIRMQLRATYDSVGVSGSGVEVPVDTVHSMATSLCASATAMACNASSGMEGQETSSDTTACTTNTPTSLIKEGVTVGAVGAVGGEEEVVSSSSTQMDWNQTTSAVTANAASPANTANSSPQPGSPSTVNKVQYNWQELVCAVCWYRVNRTVFEAAEQWGLAQKFLNLYGDSAPFIAAAYCASSVDNQSSFVCPGEDEKKMALAFMGHFPEDMEGWYEYNAGLEEPMLGLERAEKGCRCIPRHFKNCPTPFDGKLSEGDSKRARKNI
jgi:hypothetical protein